MAVDGGPENREGIIMQIKLNGTKAASRLVLTASAMIAAVVCATMPARALDSQRPSERSVVVVGDGSVAVAPDHARIRSGVTTRGKTAREATDANSKAMAAVMAALVNAGVAQSDIRTARFTVQPVYVTQQNEQKLSGFAVSNQLSVTIRQIDKVGETLDRLIAAGATDAGGVEFLHSDIAKALDQAREAAMADAKRKAVLYARAADLNLGDVNWITEDAGAPPPYPMLRAMAASGAAPSVSIAAGEDTLHVHVTVGFDLAH
jgi:uncharacterized protein YggE